MMVELGLHQETLQEQQAEVPFHRNKAGLRGSMGNICSRVHAGKLGNTWQLRLNSITSITTDMDEDKKRKRTPILLVPRNIARLL